MNKFVISFLLFCFMAFGLTSCQIYGLTSGVELLSKEDQQKVISTNNPIDSLTADGNVYVVSIPQIKDYIAKSDTLLVYHWVPGCTASQCVLPSFIEHYCDSHDYKCLLLLISFTSTNCFSIYDAKHSPLIMPDFSIYGTKYKSKYYSLFNVDMTGRDDYDIWLFANGKYVKSLKVENLVP